MPTVTAIKDSKSNQPVVAALKNVLADSYMLYLKTQNYHWNVTGPRFRELHLMFEEQYTDLAMAIDTIAELIRGLGEKTPGTFDAYQKATRIKPGDEEASAEQMVKELRDDHETIQQTLKAAIEIADDADDEVVEGALTDRLTVHRKNAWMLASSL